MQQGPWLELKQVHFILYCITLSLNTCSSSDIMFRNFIHIHICGKEPLGSTFCKRTDHKCWLCSSVICYKNPFTNHGLHSNIKTQNNSTNPEVDFQQEHFEKHLILRKNEIRSIQDYPVKWSWSSAFHSIPLLPFWLSVTFSLCSLNHAHLEVTALFYK